MLDQRCCTVPDPVIPEGVNASCRTAGELTTKTSSRVAAATQVQTQMQIGHVRPLPADCHLDGHFVLLLPFFFPAFQPELSLIKQLTKGSRTETQLAKLPPAGAGRGCGRFAS